MTIIPERADLLDFTTLDKGAHEGPDDGVCVMEAVAFVAGEPWSDHPACASPVIAEFLRTWNDNLDDGPRQDLKQHITRLVGSAGTSEQEDTRAWMALDWLIRTHTPAWLRLAGLTDQAATIAGLPDLTAGTDMSAVRPVIDRARRDAAWAAADAARAAARDAADAAWDAAAWDAAAWDAAAWDAAWAAAWDAAAWDAAAWDAAWAAAGDALEPTVREMQESAHMLIDRMLAVTEPEGDTHA